MSPVQKSLTWIKANKVGLPVTIAVTAIGLIPLYGIAFPPLVDMAEHIFVSKLLWEKVTGTSHLDLTISWFLGYHLFPLLMLFIFALCTLSGISFVHLPAVVAGTLIVIHVIVIVIILYFQFQPRSRKETVLAACLVLPAVAGMYSAAWFLGLVNFTLAITLLMPGIFLTERFLTSGRWLDALLVFLLLGASYMAHPFAPTFWLVWCFCRSLVSLLTLHLKREWKRIIVLGLIFLPIFIYQFIYQLIWSGGNWTLLSHQSTSLFISFHDWYFDRIDHLWTGYYLRVDDASHSQLFALFALGMVLLSTGLGLRPGQSPQIRQIALSNFLFLLMGSWINEKVFPVPSGTWLAYDIRFSLVLYVIGLTVAGLVCFRSLVDLSPPKLRLISCAVLALLALVAVTDHLGSVRRGYVSFDTQARKYMAQIFNNIQPAGNYFAHTQWHIDGTYLNHYICLIQPDCLSQGSTFNTGYAADLYPVKMRRKQ